MFLAAYVSPTQQYTMILHLINMLNNIDIL